MVELKGRVNRVSVLDRNMQTKERVANGDGGRDKPVVLFGYDCEFPFLSFILFSILNLDGWLVPVSLGFNGQCTKACIGVRRGDELECSAMAKGDEIQC